MNTTGSTANGRTPAMSLCREQAFRRQRAPTRSSPPTAPVVPAVPIVLQFVAYELDTARPPCSVTFRSRCGPARSLALIGPTEPQNHGLAHGPLESSGDGRSVVSMTST